MTFVSGASASIVKTLIEIDAILEGSRLPAAGRLRSTLRKKLRESLVEVSESWYRKGFSRGHKEAFRAFRLSGAVPKTLGTSVERRLLPRVKRSIRLKSTLSRPPRARITP
jgi:hypothetical protein